MFILRIDNDSAIFHNKTVLISPIFIYHYYYNSIVEIVGKIKFCVNCHISIFINISIFSIGFYRCNSSEKS